MRNESGVKRQAKNAFVNKIHLGPICRQCTPEREGVVVFLFGGILRTYVLLKIKTSESVEFLFLHGDKS